MALVILNITYTLLKLHNTLDLCNSYCNSDIYEVIPSEIIKFARIKFINFLNLQVLK